MDFSLTYFIAFFFKKIEDVSHLKVDIFDAIYAMNEGSLSRISQLFEDSFDHWVLIKQFMHHFW
ncbi:MAG: hypothetical protein VW236_03380, partial [Flavobacteriaceae bacterium]